MAPSSNAPGGRSNLWHVFDATAGFGTWRLPTLRPLRSAIALIEEMDWCGIDEALVYNTAQRFDYQPAGNDRLMSEIAGQPRLHPTLTLLPSATREGGERADPAGFRKRGVRAIRLFPQDHRYLLDDVTLGDRMRVLEELRIPVFIRDSLDRISTLLRSFPALVAVADGIGGGPLDRYAWPMAERYPGLHFETSSYLVDGGIEAFVRRFGPGRLLFSSGVPMCTSGASLFQVLHADLDDNQRTAILAGNLERLLGEAGQ